MQEQLPNEIRKSNQQNKNLLYPYARLKSVSFKMDDVGKFNFEEHYYRGSIWWWHTKVSNYILCLIINHLPSFKKWPMGWDWRLCPEKKPGKFVEVIYKVLGQTLMKTRLLSNKSRELLFIMYSQEHTFSCIFNIWKEGVQNTYSDTKPNFKHITF